jgi:hypothetical protein
MTSKLSAQSSIRRIIALVLTGLIPLATTQGQQMNPNSEIAKMTDAAPTSLGFTFLPAKSHDSGGQLAGIVLVADVNGDGKPDLLVLNDNGESGSGDGSVGVMLGNGDGTFRKVVVYDSGGVYATGFAVADLNGDGKLDLVVASDLCFSTGNSQCLGVLLGVGDGTFKPVTTFARDGREAASGPGLFVPVMIADINGDGRPDLIVVNQTDSSYGDGLVGVLLGNGDGTFQSVVTYDTGGFGAFAGILADVNGDSKPDLVVLNCSPSGSSDCSRQGIVSVLLGNGDGTFRKATLYDSGGLGGTNALFVADVNGDGKPDILVGNNCPGNCSGVGSFGVLLGKGDGTFQGVVTYSLTGVGGVESIAVADLNGDGKPDLAMVGNGIDVWLGKGDGTFQFLDSYATTGAARQVLLTDLDGDGKLDFVDVNMTANTADARLGNGDGTFGSIKTFSLGGKQISWGTIADLNGDGRPDLVSANWCSPSCQSEEGAVGVLLNVASNPNTTSTTLASSLNPAVYGQRVTFTAKVTSNNGPTPTGRVIFMSSGQSIGAATLNARGVATLSRSNLNASTYSITATYLGDANNIRSQSTILNEVINPTTSTATLTSSPNPSSSGQAVTFTAKITSPTIIPTGSVSLQVGKTVLGTAQLSAGKAVFTTSSLPLGTSVVTVIYERNPNIKGSWASVRQTVQ